MIAIDCKTFFDRAGVAAALDKRNRRVLNRWGGYARRSARSSIRRVGNARPRPRETTKAGRRSKAFRKWLQEVRQRPASPPGSPPFTHTGGLRNAIMYAYDPGRESVIVGPLGSKMDKAGMVHELGARYMGANYPARPYMRPARTKAIEQLPRFYREAA